MINFPIFQRPAWSVQPGDDKKYILERARRELYSTEKASTTHWFMCPAPGYSALQASVKHGARCSCTPPPRAFIAIAPSKQAYARVQGEGATREEMIRMRK